MKNKLLIIIPAIILVALIGSLIFFNKKADNSKAKLHYESFGVSDDYKNLKDANFVLNKYEKFIINEDKKEIKYAYHLSDGNMLGKIYIANDGRIHITEDNETIDYILSDVKFKTLYIKEYEYPTGIYAYAISLDKDVYLISITKANIKETQLTKLKTYYKSEKFVNIRFLSDTQYSPMSVFVLTSDNKIIDVVSDIIYDDSIKEVYSQLYVYSDNTASSLYGNMLEDKNGKNYIVKYIFQIDEAFGNMPKQSILVVTEDNRFVLYDSLNEKLMEYYELIKDITYNNKVPFFTSDLKIKFDNGYEMVLKASMGLFYAFNKLEPIKD